MTDPNDNLRDRIRTGIIRMCDTWDISLRDPDDIRITQTDENTYEVTLPITGRVLLDDLLDNQGTLMYMKDDVEIQLEGFAENRLLFKVVFVNIGGAARSFPDGV